MNPALYFLHFQQMRRNRGPRVVERDNFCYRNKFGYLVNRSQSDLKLFFAPSENLLEELAKKRETIQAVNHATSAYGPNIQVICGSAQGRKLSRDRAGLRQIHIDEREERK